MNKNLFDTLYWTFSGISLTLWCFVYFFQIYSRSKNVNNISFYLTILWFFADAIMLFCTIIKFNTLMNLVVIETLLFFVFDIISLIQYIILSDNIDKQKKITSIFLLFVYAILITVSYYFRNLVDHLTWLSISILIISRFPQILEYYKSLGSNISNPKLIIFILFLTICANYFYIISIVFDIYIKNNPILLIPWLICKSLIIILDFISIFIVYKNMKKSISTN
jgi:hypothetical protein